MPIPPLKKSPESENIVEKVKHKHLWLKIESPIPIQRIYAHNMIMNYSVCGL